jgi:hypothetical protein
MSEHRIHAWKLRTTALGCMSCHLKAQVVANVWAQDRDWLVLFLCMHCLLQAERNVDMLRGFLAEKRMREQEAREFAVMCKKRKRGMAA